MSSGCTHRLIVAGVTVDYGLGPVLENVDLGLSCGRTVALLGPNGAGKTTLLKAIGGLVPLAAGVVRLHGEKASRMARSIAYVPQREEVDWDFPVTVRGLAEMGRYPALGNWGRWREEDDRVVDEALAAAGVTDLAGRQIRALSAGQQQRAFLARAWAQQAHVYLLDEPFTGLDRNASEELVRVLRAMAASGKLLLASHHDLGSVQRVFDEAVVLNRRVIWSGEVQDPEMEAAIVEAYGERRAGEGAAA